MAIVFSMKTFLHAKGHSASKFTSFEDLQTIKSMGLRGKVLVSMTYVGHVTVMTIANGQLHGYRVYYRDGVVEHDRPKPRPVMNEAQIMDADVMWFRNPFPQFFPDGDFQIACDRFFGNQLDRNNTANGGFNFVKSNNRTIEFYKFWYSSRDKHPGHHDQDVLNSIKFDPFVDEIGLKMRFLSTAFFGGLCEPSRNFSVVCTMHANCCVGLNRKVNDLRLMLEDWRRYMALPPALKNSRLPFWRVPQNCSIAPLQHQI